MLLLKVMLLRQALMITILCCLKSAQILLELLLIRSMALSAERLIAIGFGETQLLDTANTAAANEANRRIAAKSSCK